MLINKRVEETILGDSEGNEIKKKKEYRILPQHMYGVSIRNHYLHKYE